MSSITSTEGLRWFFGFATALGILWPGSARAEPASAQVAAGASQTCALKADRSLYCWGKNNRGQLGDGTQVSKSQPALLTSMGSVTQVSAHETHTCARKTDGTLWCWGDNSFGQLGDGTTATRISPIQVSALGSNVIQASVGSYHTCALRQNGSVWCWGWNLNGQLGDGTANSSSTPVQVTEIGNSATEISSGNYHTCARLADQTAWCWGYNILGQLGDGTNEDRPAPGPMSNVGSTVVQISAGDQHTCVVRANGSVWCVGDSQEGQVGNNSIISRHFPIQVLTGALEVSAGGHHTCARKADGTLWCWGRGDYGQLGSGFMATPTLVPTAVPFGNVAEISTGRLHTCFRRTNGTLWCTGRNADGELGIGSTADAAEPAFVADGLVAMNQVPALTAWGVALLTLALAGIGPARLAFRRAKAS